MARLPRFLWHAAGLLVCQWGCTALAQDCQVSSTGVAFGSYDTFSMAPQDSAGDVAVACSTPAPYTLALSSGGGTYAQRGLAGAGTVLFYNLFTDASRTVVWGDGSSGTATLSGNASSAHHSVYGRIPARQNVPAGSYADALVITVSY